MTYERVPLVPKNPDGPLRVLSLGRVSKPKPTEDQTEQTLESSLAAVKERFEKIYEGPIELKELAEQESGLIADRATALEAMELIATGEWDVVIAEDLGRIFRNPRYQYIFVQDAVDADTRVICFGDQLDTTDENWELMMGAASFRHGMTIPDTRRRVKRTSIYSFHKGGNVQKVRFGYRKLTRSSKHCIMAESVRRSTRRGDERSPFDPMCPSRLRNRRRKASTPISSVQPYPLLLLFANLMVA